MAVPDFQTLMLPILQVANEGNELSFTSTIEFLADYFDLSQQDRIELLGSGKQTRLQNRFYWATIYLRRAGLIETPRRGIYLITKRGNDVLRSNPTRITTKFLMQFPEFAEFRNRSRISSNTAAEHDALDQDSTQTPEEIIDANYLSYRRALGQELLEKVKSCSPRFFELLVLDLLLAMGYGGSRIDAGQAIGQTGDDGIDGIIKEDKLGLDVIYIQAKRWSDRTVGRPDVQSFVGSLEGNKARKGVFITTSRFSKDAEEYVARIERKIILIDGEQLAKYMIDFNVGLTQARHYLIMRIDNDYFDES